MEENNNNTTIITPELLIKYVEKKVNFDEWLTVFTAELKYEHIRDIVRKIRELYDEAPLENPRSMDIGKVVDMWKTAKPKKENSWLVQHAEFPIERWAAKTDSNDCVIRCEQYVLEKYGVKRSLIDLRTSAEAEEWRKEEGTPLYHIGRLIENSETPDGLKFSLARFTRDSMKQQPIEKLRHELMAGCHVILAVSQEGKDPDHAIVVTDITTDTAKVFDPGIGFGTVTLTHEELLKQWKPSHYYMVSITLRGRRPYTPHPEDLSDVSLEKEIENLAPILMENAHEVWAKARQSDGWTYGEKKDDDLKVTPFMLPYSEMADNDKKTDYLTTINTLKFLKKIGYIIVKKNDTGYVFRPNQRNAAGEYIANPADLDSVQLPENILALREYIAENVHEDWSHQRMAEGYVYAEKTDEKNKTNKDLVPYCELLDSEKQYDRDMAYNTLRMLYKMGYVIEKSPKK